MARRKEQWDVVKTKYYEDEDGKHKKLYHRGGLITEILEEPSEKYKKTEMKKGAEVDAAQARMFQHGTDVAKKLIEMAERELEEEGKL